MYEFGVYHWRTRLRKMLVAVVSFVVAAFVWRRATTRRGRVVAIAAASSSAWYGAETVVKLLQPLPWRLNEEMYDALASGLPYHTANRTLDIGCGTGRSLVGLIPSIPDSCAVTGIDVFSDVIIWGNDPHRARTNARRAGHDVNVVAGDATRLPFADDTHDIVTICQVLHDLSAADARRTLEEAGRVCTPDGTVGVLELPLTHGHAVSPERYWRSLATENGLDIVNSDRLPWKNGREYVLFTARPTDQHDC